MQPVTAVNTVSAFRDNIMVHLMEHITSCGISTPSRSIAIPYSHLALAAVRFLPEYATGDMTANSAPLTSSMTDKSSNTIRFFALSFSTMVIMPFAFPSSKCPFLSKLPSGKQPDKTLSASLPQRTAPAIHFSAYTTAFQSVFCHIPTTFFSPPKYL